VINANALPCDEAAIRSTRVDPRCVASRKIWILAATILGSSMAYIDGSVVNVALPAVEADLEASLAAIQWVINAYALALSALLLIGGAAADRFGRRRVFVIGIAIFAAASVWCGLAPGVAQLILARAAQGIGAALLIPCSLAIIGAAFEETQRGAAIGTWAGFSAIAAAVGPVLGGAIVDFSNWRWIFLINPVVALLTIAIVLRHVPESRDPEASPGLDWPGALLAFVGLGSLVFALIESSARGWRDATILIFMVVGASCLAAFVWVERNSRVAMMPLALFRSRTFAGINLMTLLLYGGLGAAFFFLPFDLIQVHGFSATLAGAVFLPFTIIVGVLSRWSGALADRFGARLPLIAGPAIAALGYGLLALPRAADPSWATFVIPLAIVGVGMGLCVAPLTTTVINAVPTHRAGVASGINNAVASVARLVAVAVFAAAALTIFDRAIDERMAREPVPAEVKTALAAARGKFVVEPAALGVQGADRRMAESIVRDALARSIRIVMGFVAALTLAAAICAAVNISPGRDRAKEG
jgi:EmrB/QacA subfamily drug resistance transporter